MPEKTAEAVDAEGWMHTGDLATIDDAGYCNIVGRIKDMVIRGGENVYPREIEEYLFRHPKVEDVQVIGVPDPRYGEEICAWVKLRGGETATRDEIVDFCKGQIAHYKVPRYVKFVDSVPDDGDRQDPEVRDAQGDDRGAGAVGTEDGVIARSYGPPSELCCAVLFASSAAAPASALTGHAAAGRENRASVTNPSIRQRPEKRHQIANLSFAHRNLQPLIRRRLHRHSDARIAWASVATSPSCM